MEGSEGGDHSGKPEPRMILKITPNGFQFYSLAFKGPIGAAEAVASGGDQLDDDQCNKNNAAASNILNVAAENVNGGGTEAKCSVCSKTFHSEKALHGHMRCHPERDRRGANPPLYSSAAKATDSSSSASMSSSSTLVSSDIPPPQPSLIWSKTGRRGHNRTINGSTSSTCTISSLHKKRMEENHQRDYPSKKLNINNGETLRFGGQDDGGHESSWQSFLETRKYKCRTCHKVFPTLQDLIGNKSSDSYKEAPAMGNNMYASSSRSPAPAPEKEGVLLVSTSRHVKQAQVVRKSHKCKICNKSYPTGQALGGHQTTHRQKSAKAEAATPQQQEPVLRLTFHEEDNQSEGPRVLDFDLNENPPVEEGEEEQQQQN